ncbi:auxin-responsive protein IAA26 isoform X2 [Vitis vinifera]|uniref:auxin-responsive protein IAA26 isoform X2 n=1 Tax=Vitis vinifera TaxID=29760 RepID=UPI00023B31BF|nr:auxin-responsive protein IAA26 isoform X2 [Vitis vinifera]
MEGCSRKDEVCPQLLDLISKDREWVLKSGEGRSHGSPEEKKLELRLGPPGEDWTIKDNTNNNNYRERDESLRYLRYLSSMASMTHNCSNNNNNSNIINNTTTSCGKRGFLETVERNTGEEGYQVKTQQQQQQTKASFLQFQSSPPVITKESSQPCCTKVVDLQNTEKKAFSPASANTAVPNSSQKRSAPTAVVGWPPIRSFRKNLASSSSSKPANESQDVVPNKIASEKPVEVGKKGLFVKINMDGVPIGRKVDLTAYDSYEKLSSAVDELFRGLLAAQRDSSAGGIQTKHEEEKTITGLLDGSGEYTLVYEDNEGDRVLVGDVPWHMFVNTVKRLRVLKSSELSALCLGSSKQEKAPLDSALK